MKSKIKVDFLIFGATGMQGNIVTRDLVESGYRVFISGRELKKLEALKGQYAVAGARVVDLRRGAAINKLLTVVRPTVIVNCAEGNWNLDIYRAALKSGVSVIDLGSDGPATEEQIKLDDDFNRKNLTAITGCGSTPGINNVMLKYAIGKFDEVETIEAGFAWNSNIKKFVVPFSMESILEEFTQAAPVIEAGKWSAATPLETVFNKHFRWAGAQKCFLVRHPEVNTFYFYFKKMGLSNVRFYAGFPEHSYKKIKAYLNHADFVNKRVKVEERGGWTTLGDLTAVLQEMYPPPAGYKEKENLWVVVSGKKSGRRKKIVMECLVPTLPEWLSAGCNIDTGFPASIMAQMILRGVIKKRGSFAPEAAVPALEFFKELKKKKMKILINGQNLV